MIKKYFTLALLLFTAVMAQAQMDMAIPMDTAVRTGKLDNGLTYYIRHNGWPEHRANFYIAQKVGSLQEDESQRGLAHFLEHMCFNGTEHFKDDGLIRYLETLGVRFGADLNAYTSIDQTVYNIDNVPTTRQTALDSCMLILYDWANGLTLDPKEIDKERGVIHEEWRLRSSASMRMLERSLPTLYPGSKYGQRMPIGLMSVIDNFKYKELRDYYEKWYNPENQGIIVVGDVDVDHTEQMIKKLFGGIKAVAGAGKVVAEPVPDNAQPIVVIEKDKEQNSNEVEIYFKHEAMPDSLRPTLVYMITKQLLGLAQTMMSNRYNEAAQKADCPYVSAFGYDDTYIFSKTKDAYSISVSPKEGKTEAALTAALVEARRAAEFGFTASEFDRAIKDQLSYLDKQYSNRDKRTNSQLYNEILGNFLYNNCLPSIDMKYMLMKKILPTLNVDMVNQMFKELVSNSDSNMVVLNFNVEKEGTTYPTKESLLAAVAAARKAEITPYVDNVKNEPLIQTLPKAGKIKKETENKTLGYKELTLSNGIKVLYKKTDFKKDVIGMTAQSIGGSSLYGMDDWANVQVFDEVIASSGLGNFSNTELSKALAGKIANANLTITQTSVGLNGTSTPKDLETMLQLTYLYMTNIKKDEESYKNLMDAMALQLKNQDADPMSAFSDSLTATLYNHSPRQRAFKIDDIKNVNYDRILQIAKEVTANAGNFRFTFVGNLNEDTLRTLVCRYLGALPAKNKAKKGHRLDELAKGEVVNNFTRKMETPKAMNITLWYNDKMPWTLENSIKAQVTGQILTMIYLKKIREDASAAYSVGAYGAQSHEEDGYTIAQIMAQCPVKPAKADTARIILLDEVEQLTKTCEAEKLQKVKEQMSKQHEVAVKTNNYWMNTINTYDKYGVEWHTRYNEVLNSLKPQDICDFMKEFTKQDNRIEVVMLPADFKE